MNDNEKVNVLIVDDRVENLLVLESILENEGINIIKALSGNEALGLMLTNEIALVLLDVQMPDMDGFETAELMRSSEKTKYIPIIFVTAISKEKSSIFKGYEVGAVDYLFKPIDPIILKSKVNVFIELYKHKKQIEFQKKLLEEKIEQILKMQEANYLLEHIALEDALTKVSNRRNFDKMLNVLWRSCRRENSLLSMLMVDIDYFKNFNDLYGHIKGDECLIEVANSVQRSIRRPGDFLARYGGEEFAVLLPHTDTEGALVVAEFVRRSVEALRIPHSGSEISEFVTISVGISTINPNEDETCEKLVLLADRALYKAKAEGRNRFASE